MYLDCDKKSKHVVLSLQSGLAVHACSTLDFDIGAQWQRLDKDTCTGLPYVNILSAWKKSTLLLTGFVPSKNVS